MLIDDPYEFQQEKNKWKQKFSYILAKVFQGIFYIVKLLAKLAVDVIAGVLKTFKIPVPRAG